MHAYRTHNCGELRLADAGRTVRLSGWIHRKRDHGNLLFIDLRDHYGITQCVVDTSSPLFREIESVRVESVVTLTGRLVPRTAETINPKLAAGEVELRIEAYQLQAAAEMVPRGSKYLPSYPHKTRLIGAPRRRGGRDHRRGGSTAAGAAHGGEARPCGGTRWRDLALTRRSRNR